MWLKICSLKAYIYHFNWFFIERRYFIIFLICYLELSISSFLKFKWIKNELLSQVTTFLMLSSRTRQCLQPSAWLGERAWPSAPLGPASSLAPVLPLPALLPWMVHHKEVRFLRYLGRFSASGPPPWHLLPLSSLCLISSLMWQNHLFFKGSTRDTSSIKPPSLLPRTDQSFSELNCINF